jgi:tRNA pseudouridine38-40 synthase
LTAERALGNVRLLVAYDGTDFHGFAASPGVPTVLGTLAAAVERVVRQPVELVGAGRTDAGVHAWGQVVSGRIPASTDLWRLVASLNRLCAPAISVRAAEWTDPSFSARFSATARTYRYQVWNAAAPNPLTYRHSWHVPAPLDLVAMNGGAAHLVGEHDFGSFCRRPKVEEGEPAPSLVRRVQAAEWETTDQLTGMPGGFPMTVFEITASAFCHQMVRSIVGTLVDVGLGRRSADSVATALAAGDRRSAGRVAPPRGLVLWHVDYTGTRWDA